ncbi:MAG: DDE-type integrase/transposase/recombinase [Candidatus Wallbacteria bacterium]|nr:DDE-type integrase/transposase/recombinase [Candidatus Wallbacteria bacterium]
MDEDQKKKIALFRFGVITPLLGVKKKEWGQKEEMIKEITSKAWEIPHSKRSRITRATLLYWLKKYERGGRNIESLMPRQRCDKGRTRKMDRETELALVNLKKERRSASVPALLQLAKEKLILPPDFKMCTASVYRILKKHLESEESLSADRRRFEAEQPNDLWQTDCMHGSFVTFENKIRKSFLFAIIDDHSRLIPHAEFFVNENLKSFLDCLKKALSKRGLPRKLYTDNGPCFKSGRLEYTMASLGTALLHARPYTPEGKGKIERWFRTVRSCFLPMIPENIELADLNARLWNWIDNEYHLHKHAVTKEKPFERYSREMLLIRQAPKDLDSYFRIKVERRVWKDRTVSLNGRIFEAPVSLIGKKVELYYGEDEPEKVEVFFNGDSYGFIVLLDRHSNCLIYRKNHTVEIKEAGSPPEPNAESHQGGKLFGNGGDDERIH